ncbi:hypothetical protein GGI20_004119 [Coemansia sp. BCRC 34301]|nr:hypothetical protein GGI20_004119 [Coemansia sp. BCRC 34301]
MRSIVALVILGCLLALCNATYVIIEAWNVRKVYEVQDTKCYTVDKVYSGNKNHVLISGYTTQFFANNDCTDLVSINYQENPFVTIFRPIRSFKTIMP